MEEKLQHDSVAEVALSAMVSMIMILLFSAIVAGMALLMIEQAFTESRSQSITQSETVNSIPFVLTFEIDSIDTAGNTNDRLYLVFKFPYVSDSILDSSVKWVIMGDDGNTGGHPTNNKLDYSSGDFELATTLSGSGSDQNAVDEFEQGTYYHILLDMTSPNGNGDYDLREDYGGSLVIAVENGRTTEIDFYVGSDVRPGEDLKG